MQHISRVRTGLPFPGPGREEAADTVETNPMSSGHASNKGEIEPQPRADMPVLADVLQQIENEIPFLRRAVRRWHREKADADDLVQDTLVQALANAHLWQPGTNLRAWLLTIMRNQFFAKATKSNRLTSALRDFALNERAAGPDPRETRSLLREVAGALHRLPDNQRLAVRLVCIEDKSYEEAAKIMALSIGALRCHLARGRDRLRTATRAGDHRSPFAPRPAWTGAVLPPANRSVPPTLVLEAAD